MTGRKSNKRPDLAKDVNALRKNFGAETKSVSVLQWSVFGLIFLLIVGASAWTFRPDQTDRPVLIYNAGILMGEVDVTSQWMSDATEQSLSRYLDIGAQIQVINAAQMAAKYTPPLSEADWALSGILSSEPSSPEHLVLNIKLQSQTNSRKKFETQLTGLSTGLSDLSARASAQIYTWLEQQPLTADESDNARAELPLNSDAQIAYAKGYAALSAYDSKAAVELFKKALELGGEHPMVHNGLARVYEHMGLRRESKAAHAKAFETREGLSRSRQLELEAFYLSATNKKKRAREVFTALKEFHPHDLTYRLHIASIYNLGSKADLAMAELDEARTLPEPFRSDPRLDLEEARTWYQLGHFEKGRGAAMRAAEKARRLGDKGLLAEALLNSGNADEKLYLSQLLEARDLYEELGNPDKLAGVLTSIGNHQKDAGNLKEAEEHFEKAMKISKEIGNEPRVFFVKNSLAIVLDLQGRLEDGLEMKQQVFEYYQKENIKTRSSIMLENISISLFKLGRMNEAETILDEAFSTFSAINDSIGVAWTPMYRGRIRSYEGNLLEAENLAQKALRNSEGNPEGGLEQEARYLLAEVKFWRGQYDDAHSEFSKIETAFTDGNNMIHAADAMHMLSRVALRQRDYERAKTELMRAEKIYLGADTAYYALNTQITKVDLAYLKFEDELSNACQLLSERLKGQEYMYMVLRARSRMALCKFAMGGALKNSLDELLDVEEEAVTLGLFEPQIDVQVIRGFIQKDPANVDGLKSLAQSAGWNVDWVLP